MFQVDLDAPDIQIEHSIKLNCSKFGRIRSIRIHRSPSAFAVIQMTENEQARELTSKFGGSAIGSYALVHLKRVHDHIAVA